MGRLNLSRHAHQAQRLSIALGMRGAEVAPDILLGVSALLGADDHDFVVAQFGEAADYGAVLGVEPVAVQFLEAGEGGLEIIQREWPLGMTRHLHPLPGGEVGVDVPAGLFELALHLHDFGFEVDAHAGGVPVLLQLLNLALDFKDRLLELKLMFHAVETLGTGGNRGNRELASAQARLLPDA